MEWLHLALKLRTLWFLWLLSNKEKVHIQFHLLEVNINNPGKITNYDLSRVFFYNCHWVKSSLLSLELSFRSLLQGRQTSK